MILQPLDALNNHRLKSLLVHGRKARNVPVEILTEHTISKTLRVYVVKGALTRTGLLKKLKEIYHSPEIQTDTNVLWDLRETDLTTFSTEDILAIRAFVKDHWGIGGKSRAALIVRRDLQFGLSRMFQTWMEDEVSSAVRVFREYDEGMKWVSEASS